jgi:hypothetical protein
VARVQLAAGRILQEVRRHLQGTPRGSHPAHQPDRTMAAQRAHHCVSVSTFSSWKQVLYRNTLTRGDTFCTTQRPQAATSERAAWWDSIFLLPKL